MGVADRAAAVTVALERGLLQLTEGWGVCPTYGRVGPLDPDCERACYR